MPPTAYDQLAYPGKFYPQSSPDRLAAIAILYGLNPTPIEHCRVLELGCGDGGNLLPLAARFPESQFLGVDLSAAAIERGRADCAALELGNLELRAMDIGALDVEPEAFDYVISHGVYSWVPDAVRAAMLRICGQTLRPNGIAYISYDTLPGGYLRGYARDLMRLHTRDITEPLAKAREARRITELLMSATPAKSFEQALLRREIRPYEGKDFLLLHDLLVEHHDPCYFLDFMGAATGYGLQFVSESGLGYSRISHLPQEVQRELAALPNRLLREQYLDFINCRRFRQSILCRASLALDLEVVPERLERLWIVCRLQAVQPDADARLPGVLEFTATADRKMSFADPMPKALFLELAARQGRALRYAQLRQRICERLGIGVEQLDAADEARIIQQLVSAFSQNIVEFHVQALDYCNDVSARPQASALARRQAAAGESIVAANLEPYSPPSQRLRTLITLLDGTRDRPALLAALQAPHAEGADAALTAEELDQALQILASHALLVA